MVRNQSFHFDLSILSQSGDRKKYYERNQIVISRDIHSGIWSV